MKKFFFFLSAIALLGLTSACVEQMEVNPNYNPETREVNANFVFNIATNDSPMTKMTAANVQADVTASSLFRGINNGALLAYTLPTAGGVVTDGAAPDKVYDLPTIVPANSLSGSGTEQNIDKSRRVLELAIPTGTNAFMFYGKAIKTGNHMEQGYVKYNLNAAAPANSEFSLVSILSEPLNPTANPAAEFAEIENLISFILGKFVNFSTTVTVGNTTKTLKWSDYATYDARGGAGQKWSAATNSPFASTATAATPISPLGEILGKGFANFINVRPGAVRAGSGQSVARMIGDLAVAAGSVAKAQPTSPAETSSQIFAKALIAEFAKYFKLYGTGSALADDLSNLVLDGDEVDWLDFTAVIRAATTSYPTTPNNENYTGVSTDIHDGHLRHFPTEFGIPMGAAQLVMNDDPQSLGASYNSSAMNPFNGQTDVSDVNKIMYPAELCYFGNSPLRVSDETCEKKDYPDGAGNWLIDGNWTDKKFSARGGVVASSTRSVAMADNVNYGTAMLGVTINYSNTISNTAGDANGMYDNTKGIPGLEQEDAKQFLSTATDDFRLTGVLIGGQYKTVGWNYITKNAGADNKDFIIYDAITDPVGGTNYVAVSGTSAPQKPQNYTMVWDNYNLSTTQDPVYIALEFVNNTGADFWGEKNVIRKGGTFYIVGKLAVPQDVTKFQWPADPDFYALPPYKNDATDKVVRVFMQDYLTVANCQLGPNSLKHAYVTVPDLRSSQMSLGLSVDLQWRAGLTLDVVLGETN